MWCAADALQRVSLSGLDRAADPGWLIVVRR
jgi:hypothetical protein